MSDLEKRFNEIRADLETESLETFKKSSASAKYFLSQVRSYLRTMPSLSATDDGIVAAQWDANDSIASILFDEKIRVAIVRNHFTTITIKGTGEELATDPLICAILSLISVEALGWSIKRNSKLK